MASMPIPDPTTTGQPVPMPQAGKANEHMHAAIMQWFYRWLCKTKTKLLALFDHLVWGCAPDFLAVPRFLIWQSCLQTKFYGAQEYLLQDGLSLHFLLHVVHHHAWLQYQYVFYLHKKVGCHRLKNILQRGVVFLNNMHDLFLCQPLKSDNVSIQHKGI